MPDSLSEVLAGLTSSDVEIDADGRITVKDPQVAQKLQQLSDDVGILQRNSNCNHNCKAPEGGA
ncbi:hypothetical protein [Streptomyces sp. NPDC001205]